MLLAVLLTSTSDMLIIYGINEYWWISRIIGILGTDERFPESSKSSTFIQSHPFNNWPVLFQLIFDWCLLELSINILILIWY